MCSLTEVVQGEILRQPFFPASRGILKVTQIVCTVQQTCAYTWNGPSSFVNRIRYQNIHVVNVRQIFLLGLGVCLITQESQGQLTHGNAIVDAAAVIKRIYSHSCAVLIEGLLGGCVPQVLSFF